jgi:hypothetical protein
MKKRLKLNLLPGIDFKGSVEIFTEPFFMSFFCRNAAIACYLLPEPCVKINEKLKLNLMTAG